MLPQFPDDEIDELFDRLDSDHSGYIDVPESSAALKLLQERGASGIEKRDAASRKASDARRRAAAKAKAVLALPPLLEGGTGLATSESEPLSSPTSVIPSQRTQKKGVPLSIGKVGSSAFALLSDRSNARRSSRELKMAGKQRASEFAHKMQHRTTSRGFVKWREFAETT